MLVTPGKTATLAAAVLLVSLSLAGACTRTLHTTTETYNRGDVRRMPNAECGRFAEQASEESIKKETKIRNAEGSDLQREISAISSRKTAGVNYGAGGIGASVRSDTTSKIDKTSETTYKWSSGGVLWNVELNGCTAFDIIVKEGDCLPLISNPFPFRRRGLLLLPERRNRRSLLCDHGNKNNGHCSAKVKCSYRAFTNDLDANCQAPAPPPVVPPPPDKTTTTNGGTIVIIQKDQDCNMFTPCAQPLKCTLTEGLSFCMIPIFGKCKCM